MKLALALFYFTVALGAGLGVRVQSPDADIGTHIVVGLGWPIVLGVTVAKVSKEDFGTSFCSQPDQ